MVGPVERIAHGYRLTKQALVARGSAPGHIHDRSSSAADAR
jgi:hypothetical protein